VFPDNFRAYAKACKAGEVIIGKIFVTKPRRLDGPQWILNFPTKKDWRHPSKLEYVEAGLKDLVRVIRDLHIESLALPPLGCGHGGLDWALVRPLIVAAAEDIPTVRIEVYEPTETYQASQKRQGVEELTLARAMMVDIIRRYSVLGFECTNLEVQKLAYFMQRIPDGLKPENPFKLKFEPNQYGPYADALRHMLDALDGSYLHCQRRVHDAGPLDPIQIDLGRLDRVKEYLSRASLKVPRGTQATG
jgi:O-acetyl-ADP-ribose deacetylase (regulator of RNase III)